MTEFQYDELVKNAAMKIDALEFKAAEGIYDQMIGTKFSMDGWLHLGELHLTRLCVDFDQSHKSYQTYLTAAFQCFDNARKIPKPRVPGRVEAQVSRICAYNLEYYKIKIVELVRKTRNEGNFSLLGELFSTELANGWYGNKLNDAQVLALSLASFQEKKNVLEEYFHALFEVFNQLQAKVKDFIPENEFTRRLAYDGIQKIGQELAWEILPEEEQRKIKEQQRLDELEATQRAKINDPNDPSHAVYFSLKNEAIRLFGEKKYKEASEQAKKASAYYEFDSKLKKIINTYSNKSMNGCAMWFVLILLLLTGLIIFLVKVL